jgi:hypothetical protein
VGDVFSWNHSDDLSPKDSDEVKVRAEKKRNVLLVGGVLAGLLVLAGAAVYKMRSSADAAGTASSNPTSITLDPNLFVGPVREAYLAAQKHPDLLMQLDCYCGCEQHEGHRNLLDCFRSRHGETCSTCMDEAIMAGKMAEAGTPVDQIRQALRQHYDHGE